MKKMKVAILSSALMLILAGCGEIKSEANVDDAIENGGAYKTEIKDNPNKDKKDEDTKLVDKVKKEDNKILSIYKLESETTEFGENISKITEEVHNLGGYVSSNETANVESGTINLKEAKLSLRIPKENADKIVNLINDDLTIVHESLSSVDVSEKYNDTESQIKNAELREKRIKSLYGKTNNIDELTQLDEKLSKITEEKEKLMRTKLKIDDRFSLARIDLKIKEVKAFSVTKEEKELSGSEKIDKSLNTLGSIIKSIGVGLLIFLIWAVPAFAIIGLGVCVYRKAYKIVVLKENEKDNKGDGKDNNGGKD